MQPSASISESSDNVQIIAGPRNRNVVDDPRDWAYKAGTDYLWIPSTSSALITSGTAGQVLSEFGWLTTSLAYDVGSGADFLSSSDTGVSPGIGGDASGDILRSPIIFGSYGHGEAAKAVLGYSPTQMVMDVDATFTVASADEGQSGFGMLEDGGTASVAADQALYFGSDGTNFRARHGGLTGWTNALTGIAVDNARHNWKAVFGPTTVTCFIDGTSIGALTHTTDEWPASFAMHNLTTNRTFIHKIHIYYR